MVEGENVFIFIAPVHCGEPPVADGQTIDPFLGNMVVFELIHPIHLHERCLFSRFPCCGLIVGVECKVRVGGSLFHIRFDQREELLLVNNILRIKGAALCVGD